MPTDTLEAPAAASNAQSAADKIAGARDYLATFAAEIVAETGSQPLTLEDPPADPAPSPETPPTKQPGDPQQTPDPPKQTPDEPEQTPDHEASDETDPLDDIPLPGEIQAKINARIGKITAQRKQAEDALAEVKARNAELEAQAGLNGESRVIDSASPVSRVADMATLAQHKAQTQALLDQTLDMLDSAEDEPDRVAQQLQTAGITLTDTSPATLRKSLRLIQKNLKRTLETHIPARESFLRDEADSKAQVLSLFPDLKNPQSQRAQILAAVLAQHPEIRLSAKWPTLAAATVEGILKLHEEGQRKAGKTTPKPPPTIPGRPRATPAAASTKERAALNQAAVNLAARSGDENARLAVLQRILDRQKMD